MQKTKKRSVKYTLMHSVLFMNLRHVILTKVLLSSNLRSKTYGFWLTWFIVVDVSKQKEDYTEGD